MILRKAKSGELISQINANSKINSLCFSPDGISILTAEESGKLILRELKGNILKEYKAHEYGALEAVFSPNGKMIVSTGKDKKAVLQTAEGDILQEFKGYNSKLNTVEFSPDGKYILTACDDNKIKLYMTDGQFAGEINYPGKAKLSTFSAGGDYIITIYSEKGKNTAKLQHISPTIILEYVNTDKVFGEIQKFNLK